MSVLEPAEKVDTSGCVSCWYMAALAKMARELALALPDPAFITMVLRTLGHSSVHIATLDSPAMALEAIEDALAHLQSDADNETSLLSGTPSKRVH